MTEGQAPSVKRAFSPRRLALLGSVAALALAVFSPGSDPPRALAPFAQSAYAAEAAHAPTGFADLVEQVKPAVISVRVRVEQSQNDDHSANAKPSVQRTAARQYDDPASGRADGWRGGDNDDDAAPPRERAQPHAAPPAPPNHDDDYNAQGSGFFISADGYAVTNNHVIDKASWVQIVTDDGTVYKAKVIGADPKTDLALIKVDAPRDFPYVRFSDQAPRIGDWVVAVGNPFGLGGTVTAGIVSARDRDIGSGPYDDYIQIDAPINHGNSGGPTFDLSGRVVGVNTAIYSPTGGSVGIGFDIPADIAKSVVAQLKASGHVTRAYLGVQVKPVTADDAERLGLKKVQGAIVDQASANTPAARAGLQRGDVILAIDGIALKDSRELARRIATMAPRSTIKLEVVRNGTVRTIDVTLAEMPEA